MGTLDYYNKHARAFYDTTVAVALEHLYAPFLALLPGEARLLDAGCGSGRDARYFAGLGHQVTLLEPSEELAKLAQSLTGQPVLRQRFQELAFERAFDGIWASASLLHVPKAEMDEVLGRLARALVPGGVLYASFKYGAGERSKGGRYFNDYDEASMLALLRGHPTWQLVSSLTSEDARTTHRGETWLNVLLRQAGA